MVDKPALLIDALAVLLKVGLWFSDRLAENTELNKKTIMTHYKQCQKSGRIEYYSNSYIWWSVSYNENDGVPNTYNQKHKHITSLSIILILDISC